MRVPLPHSRAAALSLLFLAIIVSACLFTLPFTLSASTSPDGGRAPRYALQDRLARLLPPFFVPVPPIPPGTDVAHLPDSASKRRHEAGARNAAHALPPGSPAPTPDQIAAAAPRYLLGTDILGRSLFLRILTGGGISLAIGLLAAALSVCLGTFYGSIAAYAGGRVDAVMMRIVDILYGLPYILLVVLLAVAIDAALDNWQSRRAADSAAARTAFIAAQPPPADDAARAALEVRARERFFGTGELSATSLQLIRLGTLLLAIGGVSWLTMARVIRGQVLSLKAQPFAEAARAIGASPARIFTRHLLPNLTGPIIVYATLTVPQAILQESFLSFLGIGVRPPLPSWGNLAADGLTELNPYKSHWWLLLFPCLLLAATLLALNFVGEYLRDVLDPKRAATRTAITPAAASIDPAAAKPAA